MSAYNHRFRYLLWSVLLCGMLIFGCAREDDGVSAVEQIQVTASQQGVPERIITGQRLSVGCGESNDFDSYRLGGEDTLDIRVFGEGDLSGRFTLGENGTVGLPLIGDVGLSGCTIAEAQDLITAKYKGDYLVNPDVSIEIKSYRPFFIIGEVRSPGRYDYAVGMDTLKASALAGGFTYRANTKTVSILRHTPSGVKKYVQQRVEENIRPGDVVMVKERWF